MMSFALIKQASISLGLYRYVRAFHRKVLASPEDRKNRKDHIELLSRFVRPGDLAFDVGANIGEKTDIMLALGADVIAFEPQPKLAREIKERGAVKVICSAVGAEIGTAELMLTTATALASLKPDWDQSKSLGTIKVPVTTLDAEIRRHGIPSFCKIDVEGFEVEVLRGLSTALPALSFEYHSDAGAVDKVNQCVMLLARLGNYEFNLTGSEGGKLLLSNWMSQDVFLRKFPECAGGHFWGDIFARLINYP